MGRTNADFEGALFTLTQDVDLRDVSRYAIYVNQAGLGLPDRDYYLDPSFAADRAAYQAYITRLLKLVGWPKPDANAAAIVAFETRIAAASWTKVEQRDTAAMYNPMTQMQLAAYAPGFDWKAFFATAGLAKLDRIVISEKTAFPQIANVYATNAD